MSKNIRNVAIFLDSSRAFDRGLLRGISRYVGTHRPWVIARPAVFYQQFSGLVKQSAEELAGLEIDGVIMNDVHTQMKKMRLDIPTIIVPVHRAVSGDCQLISDNRAAAVLAADHFIAHGFRHFAFAGFNEAIWSLERHEHFCRRLAERGWEAQSHLVSLAPSKTRKRYSQTAIVRWLKSLPKPVGIMACNDEFARSLSELCRLNGLRIPDDVSLIGVDNDELICELSSPPLSSVAFATEQAGYEAAELLDTLMAGKKTKTRMVVARVDRLIARQSTDLLAIEDEEVVKALRFIRDNSDHLIKVSDVAEVTLLSHRTLHNRFCQAVGHSLLTEVKKQRAAHIAKLLATTNESIQHIARSIGYENTGHMGRFFHREMGVTPLAYRIRRQGGTIANPSLK